MELPAFESRCALLLSRHLSTGDAGTDVAERVTAAVGAAVDYLNVQGSATGTHIDALIDAIRPAVREAESQGSEDLLERSVRENATMVAAQIRSSEPVLAALSERGVVVQPAYYDLESGEVGWLS